jgi:hypothetical protein
MKLTNTLLKTLFLLILLNTVSFANGSCKGGFCKISLDAVSKDKNSKKIKSSTAPSTKETKDKKKS